MQGELTSYSGSCHCGAVRFEVRTTLAPAVRCNCSFCRRRGAEPEILGLYQWNTRIAKHYFCTRCGIYTFHPYALEVTVQDGAALSLHE